MSSIVDNLKKQIRANGGSVAGIQTISQGIKALGGIRPNEDIAETIDRSLYLNVRKPGDRKSENYFVMPDYQFIYNSWELVGPNITSAVMRFNTSATEPAEYSGLVSGTKYELSVSVHAGSDAITLELGTCTPTNTNTFVSFGTVFPFVDKGVYTTKFIATDELANGSRLLALRINYTEGLDRTGYYSLSGWPELYEIY